METRRDYRKLMQMKKRTKMYAKATVFGALGLGIFGMTTQVNAEEWKANTVDQIKEAVKQVTDGVYIIKTGDTLSGISEATGVTIETLSKFNNIENIDLIYAGDKLIINTTDGKITFVDNNNTVKNEVSLTKEDRQGINEVKSKPNDVYTSNTNNGTSKSIKPNPTAPVKPVEPTKPPVVEPIKPPVVDPTAPVKPVDPIVKEYTVIVKHVTETGELLSTETTKAKENTTVEAKAIDFSDRGYELIGENTKTIKVLTDSTIVFTYRKIDEVTPPVENKVNVAIKHIGDDGKALSIETQSVEEGSTVKANAKDFTEQGYVLNDELTKSVKAEIGASITFNYRKIDTPVDPTNEDKFVTVNIDTDGNVLTSTDGYSFVSESTDKSVETLPNGNTITTHTTTRIWKKDVTPTDPTNTDKHVTIDVDTDGNKLSDTTGYDFISESTDKGVVEVINDNGDTVTTYTTTRIWGKKPYIPTNVDKYVTVNVDVSGTPLSSTKGYHEVSRSTDKGVVVVINEQGDTLTTYTTTIVWEKDAPVIDVPDPMTPIGSLGLFATEAELDAHAEKIMDDALWETGERFQYQKWQVVSTTGKPMGWSGELISLGTGETKPISPVGNSGILVPTLAEAGTQGEAMHNDPNSQFYYGNPVDGDWDKGYAYKTIQVQMSDGSTWYSVEFYVIDL